MSYKINNSRLSNQLTGPVRSLVSQEGYPFATDVFVASNPQQSKVVCIVDLPTLPIENHMSCSSACCPYAGRAIQAIEREKQIVVVKPRVTMYWRVQESTNNMFR